MNKNPDSNLRPLAWCSINWAILFQLPPQTQIFLLKTKMPLAKPCDLWHLPRVNQLANWLHLFQFEYEIKIKLLSGNKLIICALWKLQYQVPREKFQPEPDLKISSLALYQLCYPVSTARMGSYQHSWKKNWWDLMWNGSGSSWLYKWTGAHSYTLRASDSFLQFKSITYGTLELV